MNAKITFQNKAFFFKKAEKKPRPAKNRTILDMLRFNSLQLREGYCKYCTITPVYTTEISELHEFTSFAKGL